MSRAFLFTRSHLIAFASYGFLVAIAASGLGWVSPRAFVVEVLVCVIVAIAGTWDESNRMWSGLKRSDLERYGPILGFCAYPRPGTSLLRALDRYANIEPSDIQEVKMQTCSFSNEYLCRLSSYFASHGVPQDTPIEIIGVGDPYDLGTVADRFPNLTVSRARRKLSTHFNLVKAKGQYYLWFEPEHEDTAPGYIPAQGAFLVEVKDSEEALKRFNQDRSDEESIAGSSLHLWSAVRSSSEHSQDATVASSK